MDNVKKMQTILAKMQVPVKQQGDICAYTLLAMAGIKKSTSWSSATNEWIRIHDIIEFTKISYKKSYAENSRENVSQAGNSPFS